MYKTLRQQQNNNDRRRVNDIQKDIFTYLSIQYIVKDIIINENESIHTIFIPTLCQNKQTCQNYILSHGFGGSSLMYFTSIKYLINKGNVILCQIRGMGLNSKQKIYNQDQIIEIQTFFLRTIQATILHYNYKNYTFICHSFSAYLLLLFSLKYPNLIKIHIKKLIMLSPIGITTKQQDYKNYINSCSDILHIILNKFGWAFNLTFKSPLRTICRCCKTSLIMNGLKDFQAKQQEKQLMCRLIQTLVLLPDGSQNLFFKYFEPRVIPKIPLEPIFINEPQVEIILIYGGQTDWVDKTGGQKIRNRFPNRIRLINYENCGHNIPFNIEICQNIFTQLL